MIETIVISVVLASTLSGGLAYAIRKADVDVQDRVTSAVQHIIDERRTPSVRLELPVPPAQVGDQTLG